MDNARVAPASGRLLQRRWVYRTLREVYLERDGVVAKRFVHHPGRRDWRPVWRWEHAALERLTGLPVPRSLGYGRRDGDEGREIILRKEFLAGEPLKRVGGREALEMARLLAAIHERGVITGDPSRENFLRRPDGGLAFIDFGRARTFRFRSPYYHFYVGKELSRFYRTALGAHAAAWWPAALQAYRERYALSSPFEFLRTLSFRYWLWRKRNAPAAETD
ncbi:MAG TPA: hypothetical protein PKE12_03545 [Kiritimatiellia bacterium]|nr:hypothetical protein [Kiritimatiellia bacterium]